MIITRFPLDWLTVMGLNVFISLVGIGLGVGWVLLSNKYKGKRWGLLSRMSAVVFTTIMVLGLVGSIGFNHLQHTNRKINTEIFINEKVEELNAELQYVRNEEDIITLVRDLYDAEFQVVSKLARRESDTETIGNVLIKGTRSDVSNYIGDLTEEERESVLDTRKDSLNTFTVLEFASLDTTLQQDSTKLGSIGNEAVNDEMSTQQAVLRSKVSKLDFSGRSIMEIIEATVLVSVLFAVLSLLFSVFLYVVVRDTLLATGLKSFRLKVVPVTGEDTYEEYKLVGGELVNPEGLAEIEEPITKYELQVIETQTDDITDESGEQEESDKE